MIEKNPSHIDTIGASRVIFAITSRFAKQAVQQRRKRRGIAFYALHVRIRAMLKQKLYNIKATSACAQAEALQCRDDPLTSHNLTAFRLHRLARTDARHAQAEALRHRHYHPRLLYVMAFRLLRLARSDPRRARAEASRHQGDHARPLYVTEFRQKCLLCSDPSRSLLLIVLPHQDHRLQRPRTASLPRSRWALPASSTLLLICVFTL